MKSAADALQGGGKAEKLSAAATRRIRDLEQELDRKEKRLKSVNALLDLQKKSPRDLGGRGRAHSSEERTMILQLLAEAIENGAGQSEACAILGIHPTTAQRWRGKPGDADRRAGPVKAPGNKLTPAEYRRIRAIVTSPVNGS